MSTTEAINNHSCCNVMPDSGAFYLQVMQQNDRKLCEDANWTAIANRVEIQVDANDTLWQQTVSAIWDVPSFCPVKDCYFNIGGEALWIASNNTVTSKIFIKFRSDFTHATGQSLTLKCKPKIPKANDPSYEA